jgi:hypothetical protein
MATEPTARITADCSQLKIVSELLGTTLFELAKAAHSAAGTLRNLQNRLEELEAAAEAETPERKTDGQ